jgi:hypothetical protein
LPGILLGLISGLRAPTQESVVSPEQARRGPVSPNQGIKRSAASAALAGFAAGLVSALLVMAYLPHYPTSSFHEFILVTYAGLGLVTGAAIVAGLACGGLDVLYHYLLRFLMATTRQTPWRYVPFLDYATQRIFLRRPGGSYTFIHRLLRDHFAALYREDSVQMPNQ